MTAWCLPLRAIKFLHLFLTSPTMPFALTCLLTPFCVFFGSRLSTEIQTFLKSIHHVGHSDSPEYRDIPSVLWKAQWWCPESYKEWSADAMAVKSKCANKESTLEIGWFLRYCISLWQGNEIPFMLLCFHSLARV
jgi:hypothetical protein